MYTDSTCQVFLNSAGPYYVNIVSSKAGKKGGSKAGKSKAKKAGKSK
jgi:hypothetical protein